ncbi:beta-lactamase hydrolase domain-containing protein [Bythopirellula polymerisocia]|uniref:Beta-lactamase hydrolase-like protein n=1 Tax=Bythopirellula polymerisocia TaxID=2528003 RepID=A0A5C6D533_9BACT|nr:protein tyrosine phosphatase family protein [Bythopirellula polymerisocia]TWU29989.1 Beta-lactamase hydrolase-like protein [Bythopirellula polymerisocia]
MLRSLAVAFVVFGYTFNLVQAQVAQEVPAATKDSATQLEKCELGHATPVHRFGKVYLAGQPTEEDLLELKADGMRTIINLRPDKELPWNEGAAVKRAGMKYVHVPFRGEEQLTSTVFDQVLGALRDEESGTTLLHCGSANRVGAIWYAHRVLDDELDPVTAELEAKQVGLRDAAYLEKAKEYVETQNRKKQPAVVNE